jgi:2-phosphosulfolactate phosphatase
MFIDVALNPAEIARLPACDLSETTCVVFDVLRATSSMVTALAHGVGAIYPVSTIPEALSFQARLPGSLLAGERHGERIDGFDLGNSPFEFRSAVRGKTLVATTTNGTVALRACEGAREVLVGALLNLDALARELRSRNPSRVLIVCAGTFEEFALEDAYAAGMLVEALDGAQLSDGAYAVKSLPRLFSDPLSALQLAKNGKVLVGKGRMNEVQWCAQVSFYSAVGRMESGAVRSIF